MQSSSILVVEDNPITRKMLRVALESENYTVLEAGDGRTAIKLMAKHLPELVLQDLLLPDMDGFDLIQRLRALPEGMTTPILALSGFLSKLEQARSLQVGFTDYLFKPVEPSQLIRTIRSHVRSHHALQEGPGRGCRLLVVQIIDWWWTMIRSSSSCWRANWDGAGSGSPQPGTGVKRSTWLAFRPLMRSCPTC